jgi:RPA family protein
MAQQRETAWRLFAVELNSSSLEQQESGDKAPLYIITPLGARVNRVLVAGVVTEVENTGSDTEPMWRARVADPTGMFYISAGQYQPEASHVLGSLKPPEFIAIVGKVRTYKPEAGVMYISLRPEVIKVIDAQKRDAWVLETCNHMRMRINAMKEALEMEPFDPEKLAALGYNRILVNGVGQALEHYGGGEIDRYRRVLAESLRYVLPESGERLLEAKIPEAGGRRPPAIPVPGPGPKGLDSFSEPDGDGTDRAARIEELDIEDRSTEITPEEEGTVLEIIAELEEQGDGVALWEDIIDGAVAEGMERTRAEEAVNSLLGRGELQEPSIGKLKRIG